MASRSGQPDSSKALDYDVFVGPPRHIERVRSALETYMEKAQGMKTAKSKLLSCLLDMCPKHWKIHPELRVYIEDQSTLWTLAMSGLRPLFKRLKVYKELTQTAKRSLEEFKKRLEEVRVMSAEYELMKESASCSKNHLIQIEYMVRESNRALKIIRTAVEEHLLNFRQTQTEIGRDLLNMFEDVQRVTCSESLQVIDMIEDRLKAVPAKKLNKKGQTVEDLEFVLKLVQAEVDKVQAKPVDLGSRIEKYNDMQRSYSDEWETPDEEGHGIAYNRGHGHSNSRGQGHDNYNTGQDHDKTSVPFSSYDAKSFSSQARPSSRGSTVDKGQGHNQYRPQHESLSSRGKKTFDSPKESGTSKSQDSRQRKQAVQNPYEYSEGSSADTPTPVSRISRSKTPAPYNEFPNNRTSLYNGNKISTDCFLGSKPSSKNRSNVVEVPFAQTSNTGQGQFTRTLRLTTPTGFTDRNFTHSYQDQRRTNRSLTPDEGRQSKMYTGHGQDKRSSRPTTPAGHERSTSRPSTPASDISRPSYRESRDGKKSTRASNRKSQPEQRQPCYSKHGMQDQGHQRNIQCDESEEDLFLSPTRVRISNPPCCNRQRQPIKSFNFPENSSEEFGDDFQDCD